MNKNYYITCILVFLLFISCNSKVEDETNNFPINISDSIKFNEFQQSLLTNNVLDSIVKNIATLNSLGDDFRNKSLFKNALNIHFKALQLAEEINDTIGIISALNNIGTDLRRTSSNVEATEYHYRALELSGFNSKNLKSKAIAMNGLGNVFLELQKPEDAASYFEKSLAIEKELKSNLGQAINYANFGDVMKMKNDLSTALEYYNKSLQQNNIIQSNLGVAICKNAIGSVYLLQKKTSKGLKLIREAVNSLQNSEDAFHKLEIQISLCKSLIKLNQLKEAEILLNEIFNTLKSANSYSSNQTVYELKTLLSKKQQNFKTALVAKEIAIAYRDSTLALNNEVKILELENRYKTKQALQQIKFLIKEKELVETTNKNQQRIFLLLFLFMSSIIGFTYYLYQNRKRVNKELKKVNEMKSRFFGNVSHEFRTPLTLIKGPLEKMMEGKLPKHQKKDVEMMYKNANRLLHLVNQILNLSKIDAGKFNIKAKNANLSNEIKGIAQSFEFVAASKKFNYRAIIEESGNVWFDEEIVEMVITNLLSNAFKFTPKNGSITLEGVKTENTYQVSIANSVENITEKDLNVFFDRFYSKSNPIEQEGTGIGLSLVKELCTLYKAKIGIKKTENQQIKITVSLPILFQNFKPFEISKNPLIKKNKIKNIDLTALNIEANNSQNSTDNELLLIVEDNEDMRQYIASIFENKYKILQAKDGAEGIELALENIPDIIISDVMMPKTNGIELCSALKSNLNTNHIPIILLTASNNEETMFKGLNESADDFITKPFTLKVLKSKVNNLINIRKTLANKYRGEIVLKPVNELLKWGNNTFSNTLKKVLEHHITNPNFTVEEFCSIANMSRTQLHRKLKATTGMSSTEFIRVHRLKIASELMKNKNLSISDICYSSGFSNTSYFSKQFKLLFKMSPKKYKETI